MLLTDGIVACFDELVGVFCVYDMEEVEGV
jgi:hypothetical protein